MEGLTVGRIVHYVLESGHSKGAHRPAIVVRDWSNPTLLGSDGVVQLQVFTDNYNDGFTESVAGTQSNGEAVGLSFSANTQWRTSVHYSEGKEPGTWHWPERT